MGLIDQWAADTQRKSDERAARWRQRQRDRARTGQMTLMDRWAAHAQRKSHERAARWLQRQQEMAVSGQMTLMDCWAAHAQRKSDEAAARWLELQPLRQLVVSGPVRGPLGSTAVIRVYPTAWPWWDIRGVGGGGAVLLAVLLVIGAIRWSVFRRSRSWTVQVRTNGNPAKIHVRLSSEVAAFHAAAEVVGRFHAEGPAALPGWQAGATASTRASGASRS